MYSTGQIITQIDNPTSFSMVIGLLKKANVFCFPRFEAKIKITHKTSDKIDVHIDLNNSQEMDFAFVLSLSGSWICNVEKVPLDNIDPIKSNTRHTALLICCRFLERRGDNLGESCGILAMDINEGYRCSLFPYHSNGGYSVHYEFLVSSDLKYLATIPAM